MADVMIHNVVKQLEKLPEDLLQQVMAFIDSLYVSSQTPKGVPGVELLAFANSLPLNDAEEMQELIELGCEQVDLNEW